MSARPRWRNLVGMTENFYASLKAFYSADVRRRRSPERELGHLWRGSGGATYRAAWVQATGEVYVVRHGHPHTGGGTVGVPERRFGIGELRALLSGHEDVCGRPGSLGWLLERMRLRPGLATA
ncbi:MAG TPA: hypothetical protein VFZ21_01470 [Gemmatimonadaceae bacterium]|nr:hypothetical protein [Gemmatimonadaceae bacterium]